MRVLTAGIAFSSKKHSVQRRGGNEARIRERIINRVGVGSALREIGIREIASSHPPPLRNQPSRWFLQQRRRRRPGALDVV